MKPAINLCSTFRQGSSYARSFFHQVKALTELGYELKSITIVLDGETLTDTSLIEALSDPRVRFVFEGPRPAPTCFMDERSITWARTGNLALEASLSTPSEFTLWVESDLTFPCDLIELLMEPNQDIVAPIVMLGQVFYDSWGFRDLSGQRISTLAKLQALPQGPGPLTELSSVGSCLLFRSSLLTQGVRLPSGYENGLLVGFCLAARSIGARVFCRHDVAIVHPTSLWVSQVYRITFCRLGNEKVWQELAPRAGNILAGPYFDFVIPEVLETLRSNHSPVAAGRSITFATNTRREIAVLIGEGESRPALPDGFGVIAPPQPMRVPASLEGALKEDPVKSSPEELASKSNARSEIEGLKEELAQQRKAQQEAVERSMGEVKKEIVAGNQSLIANLVEQGEKNRVEMSAQIDSVEDGMEGRIVEVAEYAEKIQDSVVAPSSYLIPALFSWYSYLYKMLKIKKPVILNNKKRSVAAPKRLGFWRRLELSIRKRSKRLFGGIGFDREWYLREYPEVGPSGIDPLDHWLRFGVEEERWKSGRHKEKGLASGALRGKKPGFFRRLEISIRNRRKRWTSYWTLDPVWYLQAYSEVRAGGIDPLQHYVSFGKKEGRQKRAPGKSAGRVLWKALMRACGFMPQAKASCSLSEIEGPWWILDAKIQRPVTYWGACGLRIRIGGREVHQERPGAVAEGIASFRHLLKLPLGECTIRLDWIEEGMPMQKILHKACRVKGASVIDQEKILSHPVDGQTDMTVMPKYGFWRHLEKRVRTQRKAMLEKIKKKSPVAESVRMDSPATGTGANGSGAGHSLFVDISPIVEAVRIDGVARVTRTVFALLAGKQKQDFDVVPVYSGERGPGFFRAHSASGDKYRWEKAPEGQREIQPQAGDIFLGLGLNQEGVCTNANLLARWADEGVSVIFYVYDLLPIQYPQFWPLEAQTDILHHEWLSIVTSFDEVICISETTAKRCREFMEGKYPPRFCYKSRFKKPPVRLRSKKVKISAIALGHDFDAELLSGGLPKNANELLKAFRAKRTFLMVGTVEPRKGYRQMLEAFEQLWRQGENLQLVIVGRNGWLMEDFVAGLERHAERDRKLFWFSEVSDEFLAQIYEACGCLLAGSIDEGFGLPLVEAGNRGKSILARDTEVFREVAGEASSFFKENKNDVAEMIRKFRTSDKENNKSQNQKQKKWGEHISILINSIHETQKIFKKDEITKICVVKLDHIGDLLLATPVFRALKKAYPKSKLTAVVNPGSAPILSGNPYVDSILNYSAPWFYRNSKSESMPPETLSRNDEVYKNLTKQHYDLVVNLRGDSMDTNFARSIPHKNLLSFVNDYSHQSEVNLPVKRKENLHAWEQNKLLLLVGLRVQTDHEPEIFSSPSDAEKSQEIISKKRPTIAIAPGAGIKFKEWQVEKFRHLILKLEYYDLDFIIVGSKADVDLGEAISRHGKARNLCGQLSITELHEVLKQCVILVTNDSAPAHIGASAKTTVISITRPNVIKEFQPIGINHIIISKLSCDSPCIGFAHESRHFLRSKCNCIASITVDEVMEQVLGALRRAKDLYLQSDLKYSVSPKTIMGKKNKKNLKTLIVRGDLRSYSGYSYATRCYAKKWLTEFDEIFGNDISYHPARQADVWQHPLIEEKDILELCNKKDNITVITISSPDNFQRFMGAYNIGLFFYETDRFGISDWKDKILLMDEIKVPAPFLAKLVRSIKDSPSVVVDPVPLDENIKAINPNKINTHLFNLQAFAENRDKRNSVSFSNLRSQYSHIFFSSCTLIPRKGLPVLSHEWLDFVKENETCALLLKVSSIDISHTQLDIMENLCKIFKAISSQYSYREWNVYIAVDSLSDAEISAIQGHADAFVTCSYGEGFGLGLFESLIMRTAVVCPAHSTFLDFLPIDYPYFLQTEIENYGIPDPACVYPISARWGVPTQGSLKQVLSKFILDHDKGESTRHINTARDYFLAKTKT